MAGWRGASSGAARTRRGPIGNGDPATAAAADARINQPTNFRRVRRNSMKTLPATMSRGSVLWFGLSVNYPYFSFISLTMMNASRRGFQSSFELTP